MPPASSGMFQLINPTPPGQGSVTLLSGPPGTGKTLLAEAGEYSIPLNILLFR